MSVNIKNKSKKLGRPTGRSGRPLQLYATDEFIASIDEWRRQQPDLPGRSEAIRRLVGEALGKKRPGHIR